MLASTKYTQEPTSSQEMVSLSNSPPPPNTAKLQLHEFCLCESYESSANCIKLYHIVIFCIIKLNHINFSRGSF